jgi:tetratricopeptide (TPR) repeat protein
VNPSSAHPSPPRPAALRLAAPGWALAIIVATLVAYRSTLGGPFVLDDLPAITNNASIRSFATAWSPPLDTTVSGRPIVNLSLALNYAIGGLGVQGYHAFNLGVHLLAALTLFGVIRRTLQHARVPAALTRDAPWIAGCAALLWAVHPLQTEAVTYTIQRAESLTGWFFLLTVYAFIRGTSGPRAAAPVAHGHTGPQTKCHLLNDNGVSPSPATPGGADALCHLIDDKRPGRAWLAASFVACLLGMATKEVMAGAPLLVLLYDRTFVAGRFRAALRARGWYYAALAATWLVLGALVVAAEGRGGTAGLGAKISPLDYALTQCPAIVHYLRLALWPAPLVFDYGAATTTAWSAVLGPALLLGALLAGTGAALRSPPSGDARGRPGLGFLGAWFFILLAPSSSVEPIATQTLAEHRMYLALAAVTTLTVVTLHRRLGLRVMLAATCIAAVGFTVLSARRNATYGDALTLWADTAAKAPDNPRAITNLGLELMARGRPADAEQLFGVAVQRLPALPDLRINYANVLTAAQRFDLAITQLETALQLAPGSLEALNNLGITLAQSGRLADAITQFERATRLKPDSADSHRNLALALTQAGRADEALAHFAACARLRPTDPVSRDYYGFALLQSRRLPEAIREFEAALRFDQESAPVHNHLGLALNQIGRTQEGLVQLKHAADLAPSDAGFRNDLGVALAAAGRIDEALACFDRAVELAPGSIEAARNRAWAREQLPTQ